MTETTPAERSAAFDDALQNAGHALMLPDPVPAMARVLTAFRDEYRAELLAAATVPASAPTDRAALRQRVIDALYEARRPGLGGMTEADAVAYMADAVLTVLPDPAAIRAAALNEGADAIDAETRQAKADGVLEPDKFRPCRDASAQLRALAGCQECASGIEHTEHCPYPESHNWGCGCPTDQTTSGPGGAADETQQDECTASRSGDCLREAESETACDTEAGECVHGGKPGGEAQQDETQAAPDTNSGPGWYEVISPRATTCIAYVHENGDLYLPEGDDSMSPTEFAFAAARGNAHRLVRADEELSS